MLAAYAQYWRINLLTMLEYRANFVMWAGFTIVYHGVALGALYVTMHEFPSMNGWDFRQMFFLYALWMAGHEIHNVLFFNVVTVPEFVREGRFVLAAATLIASVAVAGVRVDALLVAFVPLIVLGGALIDLGISLVVATLSFWFVRVDTIRWVVMSLEQDFTRYPISIYTRGVRVVLAFVFPFAFMNYFPATYFLQKAETGLHLNPAVGLLTPAIGIAWFFASYAFWRVGLRHYQGTGS
jgi:ABC-2 type transport system permease protein